MTAYVLRFVSKVKTIVHPEEDDGRNLTGLNDKELTKLKSILLSEQSLFMRDEKFGKKKNSLRLYQDEWGLLKTRFREIYGLKFNRNDLIILRDKSRFTNYWC